MNRRTVLAGGFGLAAAALAGCLGASDPGTPPPSPGPGPTTPTAEFAVEDRQCGVGDDDASIDVSGREVVVRGTIGGRDTCDTATLADAHVESGELVVVVAVVDEDTEGTPACAQCLTDIEYTARIATPGDPPQEVTVIHRRGDETVVAAGTGSD